MKAPTMHMVLRLEKMSLPMQKEVRVLILRRNFLLMMMSWQDLDVPLKRETCLSVNGFTDKKQFR